MSKRRETPDVLAAILEGREIAPAPRPDALALVVPEEFTKEEWAAFGAKIRKANTWLRFAIGDWLLAGNRKWGDMYGEAERITGKSNQYLRDCVYVSRAFELSLRHDKLSWSHHRELAGAEAERRTDFLQIAAERELSVRATRALVRLPVVPPTVNRSTTRGEATTGANVGDRQGGAAVYGGGAQQNSTPSQAAGRTSSVSPEWTSAETSDQSYTPATMPGIARPVAGELPADLVALGWELCAVIGGGCYAVCKEERRAKSTTQIYRDDDHGDAVDLVVQAIREIEASSEESLSSPDTDGSGESTVLVEMPLATAMALRAWLPDDDESLPGLVAADVGAIRAGLRAAL